MSYHVDFDVTNPARFDELRLVFLKLKYDKDRNAFETGDAYLSLFDGEARSYFGWYSESEIKEWERRWFSTPVETRWTDPSLEMKWTFGSMLEAFQNGGYSLSSCEMMSDKTARLSYEPYAHPYGGNEAIQVLIKSFGFKITNVSDD